MTTKIKGSRGTLISFHEGNSSKTCFVTAMGRDPVAMAEDLMEAAQAQDGYQYSGVPPTAGVERQPGRIYVTGEGGNAKDVISRMIDVILPDKESASAALRATA